MKNKLIGAWNFHEVLNHSEIWFKKIVDINMIKYSGGAESLRSFQYYREELKKKNIYVKILNEITDLEKVDLFIFSNCNLNNNYTKKVLKLKKPKYLLLTEAKSLIPEMWNIDVYEKFDKIFTWDDSLIDNKKFFKINCPGFDAFKKPVQFFSNRPKKKKFCVITVSNKKTNNPMSAHHKRLEAIKWFDKFHPEELDFFGWDWDKYIFSGPKIFRIFNRFPLVQKIFAKNFKTYRGPIMGSKIPIYENYRFSLCFENELDSPGYITEKIFDSFFAGCIPIYLGGKNLITKYIPENTFINFENFSNYEELYDFLKNLRNDEELNYIKNIQNFLNSSKFYIFTNEHYMKTLLKQTLIDLAN